MIKRDLLTIVNVGGIGFAIECEQVRDRVTWSHLLGNGLLGLAGLHFWELAFRDCVIDGLSGMDFWKVCIGLELDIEEFLRPCA